MLKGILTLVCLFFRIMQPGLPVVRNRVPLSICDNVIVDSSELETGGYQRPICISSVWMKYTDTVMAIQSFMYSGDTINLIRSINYDMGTAESNVMVFGYQALMQFRGLQFQG